MQIIKNLINLFVQSLTKLINAHNIKNLILIMEKLLMLFLFYFQNIQIMTVKFFHNPTIIINMTESTAIIDIKNFKKDVLNKLAYKGPSHSSKEAVLLKIFKFYDLNASGSLNRNEFLKSIAKIGVVLNSQQEMDEVFYLFADSKTGLVAYKNFIDWTLNETSERGDNSSSQDLEKFSVKEKSIIHEMKQSDRKPKQNQSPIKSISREANDKSRMSLNVKQPSVKNSRTSSIPSKPKELPSPRNFQEAIEWAREKIRERQPGYILQLALRLKTLDTKSIHKLSFRQVEIQLEYLKPHLHFLIEEFDAGDGFINYAELVYCLRGTMSPEKIAVLTNIFKQLDLQSKQEIQIPYLLEKISKTPNLSVQELRRAIQFYCQFQGINDGVFTYEDFEDFFGFIGVYFKNDQDFRGEVLKIFQEDNGSLKSNTKSRGSRRQYNNGDFKQKLPLTQKDNINELVYQTAGFNKKSRQIETDAIPPISQKDPILTVKITSRKVNIEEHNPQSKQNQGRQVDLILFRIRRKLMSKGPRGFLFFQKSLKEIDIEQACYVDIYNFKKVIKQHRIDITPAECQLVFDVFDENSGRMNYIEFVQVLKGEITSKRAAIIERVWNTVKVNEFETTYNELKRLFNVRAHPDIHNGRRFQQDISKQLIESISCIQDLDGLRSEEVNKQTFIQYLETVSASIQDDLLFETIMTNVWKLPPVNKIEDMYAGSKLKFDMNKKESPYLIDHHRAVVSGEAIYQSAPFGTFKNLNEYYRKA